MSTFDFELYCILKSLGVLHVLNRYRRWISYIVCPKEAVENSAFSEVNVHAAPLFPC